MTTQPPPDIFTLAGRRFRKNRYCWSDGHANLHYQDGLWVYNGRVAEYAYHGRGEWRESPEAAMISAIEEAREEIRVRYRRDLAVLENAEKDVRAYMEKPAEE